jgi:hypothetical protein
MTPVSDMTEGEVSAQDSSERRDEQDSLDFSGVYLLTAESEGQSAVPGLGIVLDRDGLTVRKPDGEISAVLAWAQLSSVTAGGRMRTPVGRLGLVLEATTVTKSHRFVVPVDDPDALERQIVQLAEAHRSRTAGGRRLSRVLVGLVAVVVAAGITLAILVAVGAVKF